MKHLKTMTPNSFHPLSLMLLLPLTMNAMVFGPAHALPPNRTCKITTYFSNAAKTQEVGSFSTCPGKARGLTGKEKQIFRH